MNESVMPASFGRRFLAADAVASRHVPLFVLQLYLSTVTLWIGNDDCSQTDLSAFWAVWGVFVLAAWFNGFYTSWTARSSSNGLPVVFGVRLFACALESLQSPLFFAAFSFSRGKPFKCFSESLAYTAGPLLMIGTYLINWISAWITLRGLPEESVDKYARLDLDPSPLVSDADKNAHVPGSFAYGVLLMRCTLNLVRRKMPLTLVIVHFLFVDFGVGSDECGTSPQSWFPMYVAALGVIAFAYRLIVSYRVRTGFSLYEHVAWCGNEAAQSALFLVVFVFLRAKVVKCLKGGMALAYAASVPLLVLTNAYAVASSYLWLRTLAPAQLLDLAAFPGGAAKHQ
jgi:hypothetical protein